jgi:hypothetical protein
MVALLASLLASGCLIPEAPEYGPPQKTPVFIIDSTVHPSPRTIVTGSRAAKDALEFSFKVRSEDAGERLMGALFVDYKHVGHTWIDFRPYEPMTFDEPRDVRFYMDPGDRRIDAARVCHSATLLVLHESGWDFEKKQPIGTPADLASVTWFMSIVEGSETPNLSDCPDVADESGGTSD